MHPQPSEAFEIDVAEAYFGGSIVIAAEYRQAFKKLPVIVGENGFRDLFVVPEGVPDQYLQQELKGYCPFQRDIPVRVGTFSGRDVKIIRQLFGGHEVPEHFFSFRFVEVSAGLQPVAHIVKDLQLEQVPAGKGIAPLVKIEFF